MSQIRERIPREKSKKVKLRVSVHGDGSTGSILPPIVTKPLEELKVPIVVQKPKRAAIPPQCNYIRVGASRDSIVSPIPGNWREPQQKGVRNRPSSSEVQLGRQTDDDDVKLNEQEEVDSMEAALPRTFFPLGIDWDSRLEEINYGHDVSVVSVSSSSDSSDYKLNFADFLSVAEWLRQNMRQPVVKTGDNLSSESSLSSTYTNKKVVVASGTPGFIQSEAVRDLRFISDLKKLKLANKRRDEGKQRLKSHYKELNDEIRSIGQTIRDCEWQTNDKAVLRVMERASTEILDSIEDMHRYLKQCCEKNCGTYEEYEDLIDDLIEDLHFIDQGRKTISSSFLDQFLHEGRNESKELILPGKEVYDKINRRLQDFDMPYICKYLINQQNITYLDLCYNCISHVGLWFLNEYLAWDKQLVGLNLMNNEIEAVNSQIVDAGLENRTLKSLRLNGNPIGRRGGEYLSILVMFKNLEHLDIAQTDQTLQSVAWINQALMQTSSLKILDLSRILGYTGYINDSQSNAVAFSDILRLNTSLVELHLQKNNLIDADMDQIVFGLSFSRTLELLDLNFNRIGNRGAELLAGSLTRGAPLKALLLSGNAVADLGARAFSFKLPSSDIRILDLSHNKIKDQGIIELVQAIRTPKLLAFLIFGNPIGSKALQVIQRHMSNGSLSLDSIDIVVYPSINGVLRHGQNDNVDRNSPETSWEEEAQAVIRDVRQLVSEITISAKLKSNKELIYLNLTTLECHHFTIELSAAGFRIAGNSHDTVSDDGNETFYETPYALLSAISPSYSTAFAESLILRLNELND